MSIRLQNPAPGSDLFNSIASALLELETPPTSSMQGKYKFFCKEQINTMRRILDEREDLDSDEANLLILESNARFKPMGFSLLPNLATLKRSYHFREETNGMSSGVFTLKGDVPIISAEEKVSALLHKMRTNQSMHTGAVGLYGEVAENVAAFIFRRDSSTGVVQATAVEPAQEKENRISEKCVHNIISLSGKCVDALTQNSDKCVDAVSKVADNSGLVDALSKSVDAVSNTADNAMMNMNRMSETTAAVQGT